MRADAVQERHAGFNTLLLSQAKYPLPDTQTRPADEGLSRKRPRAEVRRNGAPLGSVLMPLSLGTARGDHAQRVVRGAEASSITEGELGKRASRPRVLIPARTALNHNLPAAK
jgi:hypothetical protein